MVDVVELTPIVWVIDVVEGTTQYVSEATTAVISENTKVYEVIDSTLGDTDVIESIQTQIVEQTLESVIEVTNQANTIDVVESSPVIIYTEERMPYTSKVDTISDSLIYKGEATPGTASSEAGWRIQKISFTDSGNDVDITWADGEASFNKVWDNRVSYTYS